MLQNKQCVSNSGWKKARRSIYVIPWDARRDVKLNPVDKSITHIGPDFGDDEGKWYRGAMTDNGVIYCPPCSYFDRGILKIDTNTDTVT